MTANTFQVAATAGMLYAADYANIGLMGTMMVYQAYLAQQARIESNDYAADSGDTRMMMVLDNGKWYPAILKNRLKGEDWSMFKPSTSSINVAYGRPEDLKFIRGQGARTLYSSKK